MTEVNKANLLKWVEALESGEYEQTTGALHRKESFEGKPAGFCCLGVACRAAIDSGVELEETENLNDMVRYDRCGAYLPPAVQAWLGIVEMNPALAGTAATWWNDEAGLNFKGIARLIRHEFDLIT